VRDVRIVLAAALIAGGVLLLSGAARSERAGVVRVTTERISVRPTAAGTLEQFVVLNRAITPNHIGNGNLICVPVGDGGPVPPDARMCWGEYTIGTSALQVQGVARRRLVFTLAVVGGTGGYAGYGGTLVVARYASRPVRERLVFHLTK
jgi:hypothetical protein